jgi:PPK2 family polyphosphate:nucleotide phosphotransferase
LLIPPEILQLFYVAPGQRVKLAERHTGWAQTEGLADRGKKEIRALAENVLEQSIAALSEAQELLYAADRYAILLIFQAMDAAGKDSTIKHVMTGVNPQGCAVYSFKHPSVEELDHDFMWRYARHVPERGRIGIFNRSYYEDVLITRVHPKILDAQNLTTRRYDHAFWSSRYESINAFERHLTRNGTVIRKFFLHLSRTEQKKRFLERLERPEKHWKFSEADLVERGYWDDYMRAYEDAISATSSEHAPWYVIPADDKWATRAVVADLIVDAIKSLDIRYPQPDDAQLALIKQARKHLEDED